MEARFLFPSGVAVLGLMLLASPPAAAHALGPAIAGPGMVWLWLALAVLLGIEAVTVARFHVAHPARDGVASPGKNLEAFCIGLPALGLLALLVVQAFSWGRAWVDIYPPGTRPPGALLIEVSARQFAWDFRYVRQGVVVHDELRVPQGRDVLLELTARDTLHSFDIPALGLRCDLPVGKPQVLALRPRVGGRYDIVCTAMCGVRSNEMRAVLVVEPVDRFAAWTGGSGR